MEGSISQIRPVMVILSSYSGNGKNKCGPHGLNDIVLIQYYLNDVGLLVSAIL